MRDDTRVSLGAGYRAVMAAEAASVVGDQLAKVGVALLVYERTGSASATGLTYALTFLPDLVAGPLLAPLADRFPARRLLVLATLVQAGLAATLAIPGTPFALVAATVAVIAAGQPLYKAAQAVLVRDVVPAGQNRAAQTRLMMVRELGQLAGFGGAATVIGLIGAEAAVALNALSFLLAAILVRVGVRASQPAVTGQGEAAPRGGTRVAARTIWRDRRLRLLVVLTLVGCVAVLPEAVIVPLSEDIGAPAWAVGPLLAADPTGFLIGAAILTRFVSAANQRRLIGPLVVVCVGVQGLFLVGPHPVLAAVLLGVSGAGASYVSLLRGEMVELSPRELTGAVTGLGRTALRAGQGIAAVAGGVLVDLAGSATVAVGAAGVAGLVVATVFAVRWLSVLDTAAEPAPAKLPG